MKRLVIVVVAAMLVLTACADSGSSSGTSSGDSSSGDSSSNSNGSSGDALTSDGSSRNDGSSNNGGSSGGSSNTSTPGGGQSTGTVPPPSAAAPAPPPSGFTLPEPDSNGNVKVPDQPPPEVRDETPRKRLSQLPPIPTSCLDSDLTLLDVFAPFVSVPIRFAYCLLYIGTIARLPRDIDITITAPSFDGPNIQVGLLPPHSRQQRGLATLALILLLVAIGVFVGYRMGQRRRQE